MKYKLKVSISGIMYLLAPILINLVCTFFINRKYWSTYFAFIIFFIYCAFIYIYIMSFCIKIEKETIIIKIFGISSYFIKFSEIKYVTITEDGIGLTALSKNKVKLICSKSNGKGYLFSIKNLEEFIDVLQKQNIEINYYDMSKNHNDNNNILKILMVMLIMILFADIASIFLWDILYEIFYSFLPIGIIAINIIIANVFIIILKKERGKMGKWK